MSSRGRSTASKRGVLPNLSLAGKREERTATHLPKRKKNERHSGRGGRGRGRGKDAGKERLGLIESCGIFSEGLSGADTSRRVKQVKVEVDDEVVISRVHEEAKATEEGKKAGKVLSAYASYDELWESDDDGDMQELSELLRDGFISDYKYGTIPPHVLPLELQPQFINLMDEKVQRDLIEEEEALKEENLTDVKECIVNEEDEGLEMDDGEGPTSKQSRRAARILKSMTAETREKELFMLQLPGILKVISQEKPSEDRVVFNSSQSNGNAKMGGMEGFHGKQSGDPNAKPTVEQMTLPPGRCIGKLVITKDGRVLLKAGGHIMDVTHNASEGQHEGVVMVETDSIPREGYAMHNGGGRFGDSIGRSGQRDAIYYLGDVRHHFTASLDWNQLRPVGMENISSTEANVSSSKRSKPAEVDRIRKELNELQQQRSREIAAALKRWNA